MACDAELLSPLAPPTSLKVLGVNRRLVNPEKFEGISVENKLGQKQWNELELLMCPFAENGSANGEWAVSVASCPEQFVKVPFVTDREIRILLEDFEVLLDRSGARRTFAEMSIDLSGKFLN